MPKNFSIKHEFVEFIPPILNSETLYISLQYKTMAHLCFSGCGKKVVTPLSPTGWSLTFNGRTVSISPSVGNWNLECQSHYWITDDKVKWTGSWSREKIEAGFSNDRKLKQNYYDNNVINEKKISLEKSKPKDGLIKKIKRKLKTKN